MISIIIPVYNCEKYIEAAIRSVIAQTVPDWELILVNHSSTDASPAICERLAVSDARIRVITKENIPGEGAGPVRNAGIADAKGEYLTFLDADDTLYPKALAQYQAALAEQEADVVVSGFFSYIEGAREVDGDSIRPDACHLHNSDEVHTYFASHFPDGFIGFPWNKIYRTSIFKERGVSFPTMHRFEDAIFAIRVFEQCDRVTLISSESVRYKMGSQQDLYQKYPRETMTLVDQVAIAYYDCLLQWGLRAEQYEGELLRFYQNELRNCLENVYGPHWNMALAERERYLTSLHENSLCMQIVKKQADIGRYSAILIRLFCQNQYGRMRFVIALKQGFKRHAGKLFYRARRLNG